MDIKSRWTGFEFESWFGHETVKTKWELGYRNGSIFKWMDIKSRWVKYIDRF